MVFEILPEIKKENRESQIVAFDLRKITEEEIYDFYIYMYEHRGAIRELIIIM